MEEFRIITGYPNYEVSNHGRIRNKITKATLIPSIKIDKFNNVRNCSVIISHNSIRRKFLVHRLVAIEFIPNPDNKPLIDHIDRQPSNNEVSNLRWVTYYENSKNQNNYITNTSGEKNITYDIKAKKWKLSYCNYYKHIFCGFYDTFEDAKKAKETGNHAKRRRGLATCKITEDDVKEIRILYGFGITQKQLAKQYNMTQANISLIVLGKKWSHIKFLI